MKENERIKQDFEWLHSHPELSYEEVETTNYIRAALEEAGVEILPYPLATGLVAQVCGPQPGPMVALRADIDALPVEEACALPYKSLTPGKMHACGHDMHTAVLLQAARLLQARRETLRGAVRLIFQPAEESGVGALKILETPALEGVQAIFALHTSPLFPVGTYGIRPGAVTASVDKFSVTIRGVGAHAAYPEKSVDPVAAGAMLVAALQTVVSRNVPPEHAAVVSITHFEAGKTWNVIPETAFLEGTIRTLDKADRQLIPRRMKQLAESVCAGFGAQADFVCSFCSPATDNDPAWCEAAAGVARAQGLTVVTDPTSMLGEDFAIYQETIPGVYIHAGIGLTAPNHNPNFCVDEACLAPAAEYSAALAAAALERLAGK